MDLTSLMSSLLSDQNIKAVASKAGVSEEEAASVLATALPVMLNGANGQASDAATTESFYKAVTDHAQKDPEKVDLKEGGKIVGHLLGTDEKAAEDAIAKRAGLSSANVGLILAAAAPLIMNMLGNSTSNSHSSSGTASLLNSLLGGGLNSSSSGNLMTSVLTSVLANSLNGGNNSNNSLLGSLLGSALGSGSTGSNFKPSSSASLLGSLLGGMGGMQQQSSSGMLGSLLGGSSNQQSSGLNIGSIGGLLNSLLK